MCGATGRAEPHGSWLGIMEPQTSHPSRRVVLHVSLALHLTGFG